MDSNSTPFPGKSQPVKLKSTRKPSKPISKDPPISRQRRVFGTTRSTNVPAKITIEKPTAKPSVQIPQKQPKSSTKTRSLPEPETKVVENNAEDKSESEFKKEVVCSQETGPQGSAVITITEKPTAEPSAKIPQEQPKPYAKTRSPPQPETKVVENNAEDKSEPELKKKEDCFQGAEPQDLPARTVTEKPTAEPSAKIPEEQPKPDAKARSPPEPETKVVESNAEDKSEPELKKKEDFSQVTEPQDLPDRIVTESLTAKPSVFLQKQPKLDVKSRSPVETKVVGNSSEEKTGPKLKKKGVCFQVTEPKVVGTESEEVVPQTPVASPSAVKNRRSGTPYHTARSCSKCRFDRLETASHWLGQIKLAESVGKHFVSAALFRLAHECKAEPIRNIRIEVKRYLSRHGYLSAAPEWREISLCYGLLKDDIHIGTGGGLEHGKASSNITIRCTRDGDIDNDLQGIQINLEENPVKDPEAGNE